MNTASILNFLATPRTEQEVAKKFFNSRVLPARQAIRCLIWAGQVKVLNGNQFLARTPDYAWLSFQSSYMQF